MLARAIHDLDWRIHALEACIGLIALSYPDLAQCARVTLRASQAGEPIALRTLDTTEILSLSGKLAAATEATFQGPRAQQGKEVMPDE